MQWYYLGSFFAGVFLGNFVPHFIKGVAGDPFPTPFARPPGKGLSSPIVNVLWALFNLAIAGILFRVGNVSPNDTLSVVMCFTGLAIISLFGAKNFAKKDKI